MTSTTKERTSNQPTEGPRSTAAAQPNGPVGRRKRAIQNSPKKEKKVDYNEALRNFNLRSRRASSTVNGKNSISPMVQRMVLKMNSYVMFINSLINLDRPAGEKCESQPQHNQPHQEKSNGYNKGPENVNHGPQNNSDHNGPHNETRCDGIFGDKHIVAQLVLAREVGRKVMGCQNCSTSMIMPSTSQCKDEHLVTFVNKVMSGFEFGKNSFKILSECPLGDMQCLNHSMGVHDPNRFHLAYEIWRQILDCQECSSLTMVCNDFKDCVPKLPKLIKMSTLANIYSYVSNCQDLEMLSTTGITPNQKKMNNGKLFTSMETFYKVTRMILELQEDETNMDTYYHVPKTESECRNIEDLKKTDCLPFAIEHKLQTFFKLMNTILNCPSASIDQHGFCQKNDMLNSTSTDDDVCYLNQTSGDFLVQGNNHNKTLMMTSLAGLYFTSCLPPDGMATFSTAIMKCSYLGVLFGHLGDIFGTADGMTPFYDFKQMMPELFPNDDNVKVAVREQFQIHSCDQQCPAHYAYCQQSYTCLPSWMWCDGNMRVETIKTLHHMYVNEKTSKTFEIRTLSPKGVGLIIGDEQNAHMGDWEFTSDGNWYKLSKTAGLYQNKAIKIDPSEKFRYVPIPNYKGYGLRVLHFFESDASIRNGMTIDIPTDSDNTIAMLLIHPIPMKPDLTVHQYRTYNVNEDTFLSKGVPIASFVHLPSLLVIPDPIPDNYHPIVHYNELKMFEDSLKLFKNSLPVARVKTDLKQVGTLHISFPTKDYKGVYLVPADNFYIPLDRNASLVLVPHPDFYGQRDVVLEICYCLSGDYTNVQSVNLLVNVQPINDEPVVTSRSIYLPTLPYHNATESDGFLVSELASNNLVSDIDSGSNLGIAVFMIPKSTKYGWWQYSNIYNQWVNITVQNTADPFHINDELQEQGDEELKKRYEEEKKNQEKIDQIEANKHKPPTVMFLKESSKDDGKNAKDDGKNGKNDHGSEKNYENEYNMYPHYTNEEMDKDPRYEEKQFLHDKYYGQLLNFISLRPEQKIRFKLNGNRFWTRSTAMNDVFLGFMFWDQSDGMPTGYRTVNLTDVALSKAYSSPLIALQLRYGCNNLPGSLATFDVCGKCGGNGKDCFGCDGVIQSGAVVDHCGNCTGGTTGLEFNFLKKADCAGTCGLSKIDACNQCQSKRGTKRVFQDCNGDCYGRAFINKCGKCVGGKTGLGNDDGVDRCGVCNGDGNSCKGCDGVVKSGKILDRCGKCLSPNDNNFNSVCIVLKSLFPMSAPSSGDDELSLTGAGLFRMSCFLEKTGFKYPLKTISRSSNVSRQLMSTPRGMLSGIYTFRCYDNNGDSHSIEGFKVYGSQQISVTSIKPTRLPLNTADNISVTGKGFIDTNEIRCIGQMGNERFVAPGVFVSSTQLTCYIPPISVSRTIAIYISMSDKENWQSEVLFTLPRTVLEIYAPSPRVLEAKLAENYRTFTVKFDQPVYFSKGKSCKNIFTDTTTTKLGNYRCYFKRRDEMTVRIGSGQSLNFQGDTISIRAGSFSPRGQAITETFAAADTNLAAPQNKITPVAVLSGNTVYSLCDRVRLNGRKSTGHGGQRLKYNWYIEFASTVDNNTLSGNTYSQLVHLQTKLIKMNKNWLNFKASELSSNIEYNVTLVVENFLQMESEPASLIIKQTTNIVPSAAILGGNRQNIKASKTNRIVSKARLPACSTKKWKLTFFWEIDSFDVTLDKTKEKSRLYIYPGTLKGGQTYTLTLTVSIADEPSLFATQYVVLEVIGTPLIAKIRGGSKRVVSVNDDFVLDGSLSRDLDREESSSWYEWECQEENGAACFTRTDENNPDDYTRYQIPPQASVTVHNNTFEANKNYQFMLNYYKGSRHASTSVSVFIKPGTPPIVRLFAGRRVKESVGRLIKLRGFVRTRTQNTRIWFECQNDLQLAFIDVQEPGVLLTPYEVIKKRAGFHRVGVVFNRNVLSEGVTYRFVLKAENTDGIGSSEVLLTTNGPPNVGVFEVEYENNTALESDFVLSASTGWTDNEEDLPLLYNFGFLSPGDGRKQYLNVPSAENQITTKLPAGIETNGFVLTVFVEVSDIHGAKSSTEQQVNVVPPPTLNVNVINNAKNSIDEAFASDDLSGALNDISSTLSTFKTMEKLDSTDSSSNTNETQETSEALFQFKKDVTKSFISLAKEVTDASTQTILLKSLGEMTDEASKFDDQTKEDLSQIVASIARQRLGISSASNQGGRRKRRSTTLEGYADENPMTLEEIMDALKIYDNFLIPSDYKNSSMQTKKTFTDLTHDYLSAMCKSVAYGQPPVYVTTGLVTLNAQKHSLENVTMNELALPCGQSSCFLQTSTLLGQTIEDNYKSWVCSSEMCSGACLSSMEYTHDLFSEENLYNLLTNVVVVQLLNPDTDAIIDAGQLASPVKINIPVKDMENLKYKYECQFREFGSAEWTSDTCTARDRFESRHGVAHAVCTCDKLGIVVAVGNTTRDGFNPVSEDLYDEDKNVATIIIDFSNNYDDLMQKMNESELVTTFKMSLMNNLLLEDAWRIRNILIKKDDKTGGTKVDFQLFPPAKSDSGTHNPDVILQSEIDVLVKMVENKTLMIYLGDGTKMMLTGNIDYTIKKDNTEASRNNKEDPNHSGYFAGMTIFGGAFLTGIALFLLKRLGIIGSAHQPTLIQTNGQFIQTNGQFTSAAAPISLLDQRINFEYSTTKNVEANLEGIDGEPTTKAKANKVYTLAATQVELGNPSNTASALSTAAMSAAILSKTVLVNNNVQINLGEISKEIDPVEVNLDMTDLDSYKESDLDMVKTETGASEANRRKTLAVIGGDSKFGNDSSGVNDDVNKEGTKKKMENIDRPDPQRTDTTNADADAVNNNVQLNLGEISKEIDPVEVNLDMTDLDSYKESDFDMVKTETEANRRKTLAVIGGDDSSRVNDDVNKDGTEKKMENIDRPDPQRTDTTNADAAEVGFDVETPV
uniref:REJ domain-containing protein n=2 Tax=Clytia hemisphaerica TaxID=252671 RepID=A0A7M5VD18_9CNID